MPLRQEHREDRRFEERRRSADVFKAHFYSPSISLRRYATDGFGPAFRPASLPRFKNHGLVIVQEMVWIGSQMARVDSGQLRIVALSGAELPHRLEPRGIESRSQGL